MASCSTRERRASNHALEAARAMVLRGPASPGSSGWRGWCVSGGPPSPRRGESRGEGGTKLPAMEPAEAHLGREDASHLWHLAEEAKALVKNLIARHGHGTPPTALTRGPPSPFRGGMAPCSDPPASLARPMFDTAPSAEDSPPGIDVTADRHLERRRSRLSLPGSPGRAGGRRGDHAEAWWVGSPRRRKRHHAP